MEWNLILVDLDKIFPVKAVFFPAVRDRFGGA